VSGPVTWNLPPQGETVRPPGASGFQLIGWTDPNTDAADALVQLRAEKLIGWDPNAQRFNNFDPELPGPLNSLSQVQRGRAYWALFDLSTLPPIELELVFDANSPVGVIPFDGAEVLIVEQEGLLRRFNINTGQPGTNLIDIRNDVEFGGENGLLSAALDPAFSQNGLVYLYYSVAGQDRTRLARITTIGDAQIQGSEITILQVSQPFDNHNGGRLVFGPDGFLYLGIGDGGSNADSDGHGQNRDTLLGSIIRIDVSSSSTQTGYEVPDDNPFVDVPGAAPEIFAYGFRNPWRMAFDPDTGDLYVGDVGKSAVEEIDIVVPGGNYGWNIFEGNDCFGGGNCNSAGFESPILTYSHDDGCSVAGGQVYRGQTFDLIEGVYFYGDLCSGNIWGMDTANPGPGQILRRDVGDIVGFGTDIRGEIYVVTHGGAIYKIVEP
jgi:glucose/arabinose dehydrogenase